MLQTAEWRIPLLRQKLAQTHETRPYLASYRERFIQTVTEALMKPDYVIPRDLIPQHGPRAMQVCAQLVGDFGRVLEEWPALVDAAREVKLRDVRLGRVLS
jgi:hypothetical protein